MDHSFPEQYTPSQIKYRSMGLGDSLATRRAAGGGPTNSNAYGGGMGNGNGDIKTKKGKGADGGGGDW